MLADNRTINTWAHQNFDIGIIDAYVATNIATRISPHDALVSEAAIVDRRETLSTSPCHRVSARRNTTGKVCTLHSRAMYAIRNTHPRGQNRNTQG